VPPFLLADDLGSGYRCGAFGSWGVQTACTRPSREVSDGVGDLKLKDREVGREAGDTLGVGGLAEQVRKGGFGGNIIKSARSSYLSVQKTNTI
jgi:hypothetical protein